MFDLARKLWRLAGDVQPNPVAVDLENTHPDVVRLAAACYENGWPMNRQLGNIVLLMLAGF